MNRPSLAEVDVVHLEEKWADPHGDLTLLAKHCAIVRGKVEQIKEDVKAGRVVVRLGRPPQTIRCPPGTWTMVSFPRVFTQWSNIDQTYYTHLAVDVRITKPVPQRPSRQWPRHAH